MCWALGERGFLWLVKGLLGGVLVDGLSKGIELLSVNDG